MLDRMRERERSVAELGAPLDMSQPAVSQHLRVLSDAGLVRDPPRRPAAILYRVHAAPLREAFDWLERYARFWDENLDALGTYLDNDKEDER
jgi:DNA-binding transcriptional ArsR family regulator